MLRSAMIVVLTASLALAQAPRLSRQNVEDMLRVGGSPGKITELVRQRGVDFALDSATQRQLRALGADDALIGAILNAAPETAPPAATPATPAPQAPKVREYNDEATPGAKPSAPAPAKPAAPASGQTARERELRQIAERFAPVFYQRLTANPDEHRFDYPVPFDFDRDWVGTNNWENAGKPEFKLWSYIYYSVIESEDHYFLHYAVFHPRDWSVVESSYSGVLDQIQEKYKDILGKRTRDEAEFNHENDLEGALVIVDKWAEGGPAVVAVQTVAHNHLLRAIADRAEHLSITTGHHRHRLRTSEDGRPLLYIESQKHGIQPLEKQLQDDKTPVLVLRFGKAVEFSQVRGNETTYDLVSLPKTLWAKAQEARQPNQTYGTTMDFGDEFCKVEGATRPACAIGVIGAAFRGEHARANSANPPWAWIDADDPELPQGAWFFDPVSILKRHFGLFDTRERYLYNPYLGIERDQLPPLKTR